MTVDVTIPAADGYPLAATVYEAARTNGRVVLIAPATAVLRRIYGAYAHFLAGEGFHVVTWDWRGIGGSRPRRLRGFTATMRDWAQRDLTGAIAWAAERFHGTALLAVGHSFGGQAVGLAPNAPRLRALLTVAAQSGYWGHWPAPARYKYALLWHLAMPLAVRVAGYFPGRAFGVGEDLPAGVALEWARWCRSPTYLGDYAGHRAFASPLRALSFDDDPFAPRRAVEALHEQYGSTERTHRHVAPRDAGVDRIGHFGFFRSGRLPALWRETAEWLGAIT